MKREGERLAERLGSAGTCHITSPAGTDLRLSMSGRRAGSEHADLRVPGAFGNLPAGEAYIAPLEHSGDGIVVFDGTVAGLGQPGAPIAVEVEAGRARRASGAGHELLRLLDAGGLGGRLIGELGIGVNPQARATAPILEAEKAIGTAHLAFGDSLSLGGSNRADVHIDGVICEPTIELDGEVLVLPGEVGD
jgi:leucyl aminopeptidase (aminopeptidase T)